MKTKTFALFSITTTLLCANFAFAEPPKDKAWQLVFEDDFNYQDAQLEKTWWIQNSKSLHILSSRWRENVEVKDGFLYLKNKKELREGQEWTSANLRTKEKFMYGYYEARYKYAASSGINNAFWLCYKDLEIDINEGHYPNEINTNTHDRRKLDSSQKNISNPKCFALGETSSPEIKVQFNQPITTDKIRISTNHTGQVHIRDIGIYPEFDGAYPNLLEAKGKLARGVENFAKSAKLSVSGFGKNEGYDAKNAVDDDTRTSWLSQAKGEKFIELDFGGAKNISLIKFVSGWQKGGSWNRCVNSYKIEYNKDGAWVEAASKEGGSGGIDLSKDFHTYGFEWSKDELVFYFDGKELRRLKNDIFHEGMYLFFSTAILLWAGDGEIPPTVDGTEMVVDWVRFYGQKNDAQ